MVKIRYQLRRMRSKLKTFQGQGADELISAVNQFTELANRGITAIKTGEPSSIKAYVNPLKGSGNKILERGKDLLPNTNNGPNP